MKHNAYVLSGIKFTHTHTHFPGKGNKKIRLDYDKNVHIKFLFSIKYRQIKI